MKQLRKKIRNLIDIFIRWVHGHKLDCCQQIRCSCKECPFNTLEVKKIIKEQKKKELKGYIEITKEVKK